MVAMVVMFVRPTISIAVSIGLVSCVWLHCAYCQSDPTADANNGAKQPSAATLPAQQDQSDASHESSTATDANPFRTEAIRGSVVWLNAALNQQFGTSSVPEAAQRSLAILSDDGQLLPIVEDSRGRAFRVDERLRKMHVELLVRHYERHPMRQILRVSEIADGKRYEVDYWCDVCAIAMIEQGPCACCQDENRLRKRLLDEPDSAAGDL